MNDAKNVQVFLSYSGGDYRSREIAEKVLHLLDEKGVRVWDDRMIEPGTDWVAVLDDALTHARTFVLLIPPESERSARLYFDMGAAASRAAEQPDEVRLIPVLVQGGKWSDLPKRLVRWSGIDATDLSTEEVADKVSEAVLRWEQRAEKASA